MDPLQNNIQPVEKKSFGPLIGTVIIIILLVLGGLYVWGEKLTTKNGEESSAQTTETDTRPDTGTLSPNDDVSSIEGDLNSSDSLEVDFTDLNNIE